MADRAALARAMDELSRDWAIAAVTTVLLTPFALALAAVGLIFAISFAGLPIPVTGDSIAITLEVFLGLAIVSTAVSEARTRGHGLAWCGAAAVALAVTAGVLHGLHLPMRGPGGIALAGGTLAVLGLLGWAYTPKDDYYLGWLGGRMDDPLSLEDDLDRAHVGLGFALAIPRMIVGSWADVVGDAWLRNKLSLREVEAAVVVIDALGRGDGAAASAALRPLGERSSAHVLRALERMKLVRGGSAALRLTLAGQRMASPGAPPAHTTEQRRPRGEREPQG